MESKWDRQTYLARIQDQKSRKRYPAASPDEIDIANYETVVKLYSLSGVAIVLGMTPELRALASRYFRRVICAERDSGAIELFREWLDDSARQRESIIQTDWLNLNNHIQEPVSAILGDGVFGNLSDINEHRQLLLIIRNLLEPHGRFVTRMALIPRGFDPERHKADELIRRFRDGRIDEAEFGFGMRLVGHYGKCYDQKSYILDNSKLYAECAQAHTDGAISRREYEAILRYYYGGNNCIVSQDVWETLLDETGFAYRLHESTGKEWRAYYIVYECIFR